MSELILYNFYLHTLTTFTYIYVLASHAISSLVFYPVGIFFSVYILLASAYIVLKGASLFRRYFDLLIYFFSDVSELFDEASFFIKYFTHTVRHLYSLIGDIIRTYSVYLLVFYTKRFEFQIFCLLIILGYC